MKFLKIFVSVAHPKKWKYKWKRFWFVLLEKKKKKKKRMVLFDKWQFCALALTEFEIGQTRIYVSDVKAMINWV